MGKIKHEHDKGYKNLLSHKRSFIEMLRGFVKESWVNEIDENSLEQINKSYILQDFEEKEADIIYQLKLKDKNVIFYCLLELQSSVDYQMPFRLLLYMVEIWRDFWKNSENRKRKGFKLPSIVPIVLYNGEKRWTACRNYRDMLDGSEVFQSRVVDFNYILFDINRYKDEELLKAANLVSAVFLMDKKKPQDVILKLKSIIGILKGLDEEEFGLFKGWLKYIFKPRISKDLSKKFEEILDESIPKEVEGMVSNLAAALDKMIEKAEVKGMEKGMEKGIEKTAKNLIAMGMDTHKIIEATGLSEKRINELRNINQN